MRTQIDKRVLEELNNIQEEILKVGWRGVAKKYHSDLVPGNPGSEDVFKLYRCIYENMKDRLMVKF